MARDIRRRKCDIYHGLSNELPLDIRHSGAKSVVTVRPYFRTLPQPIQKADRMLYTYKYRKSCQLADRIIAISRQTKSDLMEFWGIPEEVIDVVYQGCNPIFYHKRADEDTIASVRAKYGLPEDFILSVGTIEERKNLMLTVRAMAEGGIDIPLVACGRHALTPTR